MVSCSPPTPGCVALEVVGSNAGSIVENVFHLMRNGATQPTFTELQALVTAAEQAWQNNANSPGLATGGTALLRVTARDLTPGTGGIVALQAQVTPLAAGAVGGVALPANVTFAVKINTNFGGKSGHGRIYWMGLTTNQVTGSTITSAEATDLQNRLQYFRSTLEGSQPFLFGVLSKWHNKACRPNGDFKQMTVFSHYDLNLDSQRRRLPGRGK